MPELATLGTACSVSAGLGWGTVPCRAPSTPSEPQPGAKASALLGPQRENVLFPQKPRSALFSSSSHKCSAFPGVNTAHRSDTGREHQGQKETLCHQTKPTLSHRGVPQPGLTGDSSAPPQFPAGHGKSKPRAPRVALNPSLCIHAHPAADSCLSFPTRTSRMSKTREWVHKGVRI